MKTVIKGWAANRSTDRQSLRRAIWKIGSLEASLSDAKRKDALQDSTDRDHRETIGILRDENQRLTEAWGKEVRKSDRRGRALWIAVPVAILSTTLHFVK